MRLETAKIAQNADYAARNTSYGYIDIISIIIVALSFIVI
jgi:hypothetical protein